MLKYVLMAMLLAGLASLASGPRPAQAAEVLGDSAVIVAEDQVIDDDLYAFAGTVVVKGTVNGDLVASGGNVNVEGTINGDLIAAGGNVNVTGTVRDDIRAAGGNVNVVAPVGGDVLVAGGSLFIEGNIGGDVLAGGGSVELRGVVEGDLLLGAGRATIDGTVKGNVKGKVDERLTLGPRSRLEGDLEYRSPREVELAPGAQVLGQTRRTVPDASILGRRAPDSLLVRSANKVLSRLRWFIGTAVVGLALLWLAPATYRGVTQTAAGSPWKSLGSGALLLLLAPLLLVALAVVALLIGGVAAVAVPLAPGGAIIVLLSLTAPVLAMLIGGLVLARSWKDTGRYGWKALLAGAAILAVLGLIPVVKGLAAAIIIVGGLGAWVLFLYRGYSAARAGRRV
jgi:cytoskeletal protein CcmA (bactofilin family)